MRTLNKEMTKAVSRPVRVLQFGEGNFLRGFADYMIDVANEAGVFDGSIVVVKPRGQGSLEAFLKQDCQYTVSLRGIEKGKTKVTNRIITCVSDAVRAYEDYEAYISYAKLDSLRFVLSNTTEAGIVYDETDLYTAKPAKTFPGKLTQFLYERFTFFQGNSGKGLILLPCELIEHNGDILRECILKYADLWNLGESFKLWIEQSCIFCNTLVDRIITGYPTEEADHCFEEFGYQDAFLDTGELFGLWVIESVKDISEEFPLHKAGLPVIFTDNLAPYRERKVRILNGAHTSFSLASYLAGNDYVLGSLKDNDVRNYIEKTVYEEIIPTLSLPREELNSFADAVMERFENPFIKHALLSISLNSVSKWKTRCLPSFKDYVKKFGKLPVHLSFSVAALMSFYRSSERNDQELVGNREGQAYPVKDDEAVLSFFAEKSKLTNQEFAQAFLSNDKFFGEDMTKYTGLIELTAGNLDRIQAVGIREAMKYIEK
ncbi:MAG TPA: tagaturonate reductase [Mobilitalea sp.]|nr:tagaturonate reductase [Mobilitalea sp.]